MNNILDHGGALKPLDGAEGLFGYCVLRADHVLCLRLLGTEEQIKFNAVYGHLDQWHQCLFDLLKIFNFRLAFKKIEKVCKKRSVVVIQ